jgi:RNase P subunit RPR2
MSVIFLNTEIVIECLHCGHAALLHEDDLPKYGEEPGASLSPLAERLICKECKNASVRAYRRIDNQKPLSPRRPSGTASPRLA